MTQARQSGQAMHANDGSGFFYGWVIVLAGLVLTLIMYGIIETFGIMFKPLALDCQWDRGVVSVASMVNWITFGSMGLLCGMLSDRFGSRTVTLGRRRDLRRRRAADERDRAALAAPVLASGTAPFAEPRYSTV